jgi:putative aldouronate transport system substrate-binding protein
MSADRTGIPLNRRSFLGVAAAAVGAAAAAPLLASCGESGAGGAGSTSQSELAKIMPSYIPSNLVKPDFASIDGSAPGYLDYPANLVHTVSGVPGDGGSYTAITPLWASIPSPSGNTYYNSVNKALGATMTMQPSNGNTYNNILPPLFSGSKLPDWIQIPSFWTGPLNFGQAVGAKLADLTPYLAGDKIKQYPNLAAIFPAAWQAGIWNNKIYGIPVFATQFTVAGFLYYRADVLDTLGIGTPHIKTINDLYDLGKEINDPKAKRWAFDDIWTGLLQPFDVPSNPPAWITNDKGDLVASWETDNIVEAMAWEAKLVKAGLMNPDAIALDTNSGKQRFWSGQELITFDGQGAWNTGDQQSGTAAQKGYVRGAFPMFTASGTGTPRIPLANGTEWFSFLNKDLSKSQVEELLRIANYLAAPFGSYEYTLINFGAPATDYTMTSNGPVLTATGNKQVATTYSFLASPNEVINNPGYPAVTRATALYEQQNAKYGYKPLFYDMNIAVPASLNNALAASQFTSTGNIMQEVVRGRSTVADYKAAVTNWQKNGGNALRKYFDGIRAKYGDA